jgi:hypothetical protein
VVLADPPENDRAEVTVSIDIVNPVDNQPLMNGRVVTTFATLLHRRAETEPIALSLSSAARRDVASVRLFIVAKNIGYAQTVPLCVIGKNIPSVPTGRSLVLVSSVKDNQGKWSIQANLKERDPYNIPLSTRIPTLANSASHPLPVCLFACWPVVYMRVSQG